MENKINVAELLKDCPKGMGLDCNEFTIDGYLKEFPDIVNCENDFNKFKNIVNYGTISN